MAKGVSVAHLEQDLKKCLGITANANTLKSSELVHKKPDAAQHQHLGVDGSVSKTPKVSKGKNKESTSKGPKKPQASNQRKHVTESEAPSNSTSTEDTGKERENASASTKNDEQEKKKHATNTNSSKQQNMSNQANSITGFIRDRRWHVDEKKMKTSSRKGTKVFSRTLNSEEIPQNWRQPAPKICQVPPKTTTQTLDHRVENGTAVGEQNSSKRSSLSEIVPYNEKNPLRFCIPPTSTAGKSNGQMPDPEKTSFEQGIFEERTC